jgi:hypothetical protein
MPSFDWSSPTIQVAALGIFGVILASLLAGIFGTLGAVVSGRQSSSATRPATASGSCQRSAAPERSDTIRQPSASSCDATSSASRTAPAGS